MEGQIELQAGDLLTLYGRPENFNRLIDELLVQEVKVAAGQVKRWFWETGIAVILVHPESSVAGKSLKDLGFRNLFGPHVLGLRRSDQALVEYVD